MSVSQDWITRAEKNVMKTYGRYPIVADRGEGCRLWDVEGNSYLDFLAGVAVNNLSPIAAITLPWPVAPPIANYICPRHNGGNDNGQAGNATVP